MNTARALGIVRAMKKELDELEAGLVAANENADAKPERMTIADYAKYRGASARTLYRWIKLGMPVERRGKVVKIVVAEADAWDMEAAIARDAELDAARGKEK